MDKSANTSIECSVKSCSYHCQDKNYCSLDTIKVSNCGVTATEPEATECASFDAHSAH
jgi:hypothetical protein